MNEELMKELVAILRAMKDGTPEAWGVLVEQRATYCLTVGGTGMLIALVLASIAVPLLWSAIKKLRVDIDDDAGFVCAMSGGVTALISLLVASFMVPHIAEGLAPLGRVLEVLR